MAVSSFTKIVMKMAVDEKILNKDDDFMKRTIEKYLSNSKISVGLSMANKLIMGSVFTLRNDEVEYGQ